MHWYGRYITFTDADNQVVLRLASLGWQRSQLLDLSEAPGARLTSHRTKSRLGVTERLDTDCGARASVRTRPGRHQGMLRAKRAALTETITAAASKHYDVLH
jgi:hypothetical protein